jgi:hypothetical protein
LAVLRFTATFAGGGPAGSAAAICAARLGAKVLLAEATGCLGGMGSSGLVSTFGPVSDGKRMLVGGFMRELVLSMHQRGSLGAARGAGISPQPAQPLGAVPA